MKRTYGSPLLRLVRGGTTLSEGEFTLLRSLVEELPTHLRSVVEHQFDEYNLAQREHDRRAFNFYAMSLFSRHPLPVTRKLECKRQEAPLLRISALVVGAGSSVRGSISCQRESILRVVWSPRPTDPV